MIRPGIVLASVLLFTNLQAQINVFGEVFGIWGEENLDYRVVDDIWVPANEFLTILPGVQVRFMDDFSFTVYGGLIVNGVEEDSVTFSYYYGSTPGSWGMIEFESVLPGVTNLNYCRIESGDRAIYAYDSNITLTHCLLRSTDLSPVRAEYSQLTMAYCLVTEGGGSGLSLLNTTASLTECRITTSGGFYGRGINAEGAGNITVTGGYIGQNSGAGIYGLSAGNVSLNQVEIADNGSYGVTLTNGGELEAYRVLIHHNGSHGFFLSSNYMDASNLTISGNEGNGIFCANSVLQLTSSIIDRNASIGIYCQTAQAFISYNCALNDSGNYFGCTPGTGSIEEDPLYISIPDRNYNIQEDSPCKDAGSPSDPLDPDGTRTDMGAFYYDQTSVLPWEDEPVVSGFRIVSTYPNPFNPVLNIVISAQSAAPAAIDACTPEGRRAARIWKGRLSPGLNGFSWQAHQFASGLYLIRLQAGEETQFSKCILLK